MRFIFFLTIVLFFLITENTIAQSNYEPGLIVTMQKDTIRGFLQEGVDSELANKISFKKSLESTGDVDYQSSELLSFAYDNGRVFKSFVVREATDSTYVFAKRISTGKIDMFVRRYPNRLKPDYILRNKVTNEEVYLPKPKKRIVEIDGRDYSKKDKRYFALLNYITDDFLRTSHQKKDVSFSRKNIGKVVKTYNQKTAAEYPIQEHKEAIVRSYNFCLGFPIMKSSNTSYRASFYRETTKTEKSLSISTLNGITYRHWSTDEEPDITVRNGLTNFKNQFLSIIPFGVKFQAKSGVVKPYGYIGGGLTIYKETRYEIINFENNGTVTQLLGYPTINLGGGIKVETGPVALLVEITPGSESGAMVNMGVVF